MKVLTVGGQYKQPLKTAEFAGRTCYSSHPKMEEGSDAKFIGGIIRSGHESVIEHTRIVCRAHIGLQFVLPQMIAEYELALGFSNHNEHTHKCTEEKCCIVSGNVRAWRDTYKALMDNMRRYSYLYDDNLAADILEMLSDISPVLVEDLKDGA